MRIYYITAILSLVTLSIFAVNLTAHEPGPVNMSGDEVLEADTPPGTDMPAAIRFRGFDAEHPPLKQPLYPRPTVDPAILFGPENDQDATDEVTDPEENDSETDTNTSKENGIEIVNFASQFIGVPYRRGGSNPETGFDCSGLALYVYREFGQNLAHSAARQYESSNLIASAALQPGDLVFFKINHRSIGHVGIYAGDDVFIHAPRPGKTVEFANMKLDYWTSRYAGARRIPGFTARFGALQD